MALVAWYELVGGFIGYREKGELNETTSSWDKR
jgi:hypothetical protein